MSTAPDSGGSDYSGYSGQPGSPGAPGAPARVAVSTGKFVLLALNVPLLLVFLLFALTQPATLPAPGQQPSPAGTIGPVLTTGAQPPGTPGAVSTPTGAANSGHSGGKRAPTATPHAHPTATSSPTAAATATVAPTATPTPAATATPAPTVTPIPTVPTGGG